MLSKYYLLIPSVTKISATENLLFILKSKFSVAFISVANISTTENFMADKSSNAELRLLRN